MGYPEDLGCPDLLVPLENPEKMASRERSDLQEKKDLRDPKEPWDPKDPQAICFLVVTIFLSVT
jgi:hypothetical protein